MSEQKALGQLVDISQLGQPIFTFDELRRYMGQTVIVNRGTESSECFLRVKIVAGSDDPKDPTICYGETERAIRRKDYCIIRPYAMQTRIHGKPLFFAEKEESALAAPAASAPGRTLDEIKISIRAHSRMAAESILQIGRDLMEAKQIAGHGGWLPFLQEIGFKPSTAENWMRLAREIEPGSALAALPYSKALALLSLPPEEREDFARDADADSKSAAELRRLIEERNKAAEAANAESNRANEAEKTIDILRKTLDERDEEIDEKCALLGDATTQRIDAEKRLEQAQRTADYYKAQAGQIEKERQDAERRAQELARELERQADAPVQIKTVEIEKAPADYEQLKQRMQWADKNVDDAMQAAIAAEQRAQQAEEELSRLRMEGTQAPQDDLSRLADAVSAFIASTQLMSVNPAQLAAREKDADALIRRLSKHVIDLQGAIGKAAFLAEGAVQ